MAHTALQADLASGRLALVTTSTGARLALPPAEAFAWAVESVGVNASPAFTARVEFNGEIASHVNDYSWSALLGVQATYSHPAGLNCGGWVRVFDPGATADDTLVRCSSCVPTPTPLSAPPSGAEKRNPMNELDPHDTVMATLPGECINCGAAIQVTACSWAYADSDGKAASGFNGKAWFWSVRFTDFDGKRRETEVLGDALPHHVVVHPVAGPHRCDSCQDKLDRARERASAYDSPFAPRDFDPAYAGESWDEV